MDDEMESVGMPQGPGPAGMENQMMRYIAFSAMGEVALLLGVVFILLGVSAFITDRLGIKGSGEATVGTILVIAALLILSRNRIPARPRPPVRPEPNPPSMDSYR